MAQNLKMPEVGCTDSCGASGVDDPAHADPQAVQLRGWQYLPISRRWRCPDCMHTLRLANEKTAQEEQP